MLYSKCGGCNKKVNNSTTATFNDNILCCVECGCRQNSSASTGHAKSSGESSLETALLLRGICSARRLVSTRDLLRVKREILQALYIVNAPEGFPFCASFCFAFLVAAAA